MTAGGPPPGPHGGSPELTSQPLLDPAQLRDLSRGSAAVQTRLLDLFEQEVGSLVPSTVETSLGDDVEALLRLAHRLKGAAANVGARRLQAAAVALETSLESGDLTPARPVAAEVPGIWRATVEEIRRYRERL